MVNKFSVRQLFVQSFLNFGKTGRIMARLRNGKDAESSRNAVLSLVNAGKAELLTGDRTLSDEDNGKTFVLSDPTGLVVTLPATLTGDALKFKFVVLLAPTSGNYSIVTADGANSIAGPLFNSEGGAMTTAATVDSVNFISGQAALGDYVEIEGVNALLDIWYLNGGSRLAAGITTTAA